MRTILSILAQKFWNVAGAVNIQVKVLGIVIGLVLLLGIFVTIQTQRVLQQALTDSLREHAHAISHALADQSSLAWEDNQLDAYLQESQEHFSSDLHNTTMNYVVVQNSLGKPIAHTSHTALSDTFLNMQNNDHIRNVRLAEHDIIEVAVKSAETDLLFRVGFSTENIQGTVDQVTEQIAILTIVMLVIGFITATLLTRLLTRPILSLVSATKAVERGDYSIQVPRWADDEIGTLTDAFNRMTKSLAEADEIRREREKLRVQYISGVIVAQEAERKRIARELHDSTSQSLTSLLVGLHNLESSIQDEIRRSPILDLKKLVNQILDDVHELARLLRPSVLDDLGLINAVERYIEDFNHRSGIKVDFVALGLDERLSDELETSIYRIIQEGLTNISRHSKATTASVLIEEKSDLINLIIEDNGVGFDPDIIKRQEHSLGLQGIRERARLFGGTLTIESKIGQGTSLFIKLIK